MSWERARQPDQKNERRDAILGAAAALFAEEGLDGATLTAIARRAGMAKSNLYRYFESRDAILMTILLDDMAAWASRIEHLLASLSGSGDVDGVITAFGTSLAEHPRMCALSGLGRTVLERQVSNDALLAFKRDSQAQMMRGASAISSALPGLPVERVAQLVFYVSMFLRPAWQEAHPSQTILAQKARLSLGSEVLPFQPTVTHLVGLLLRGFLADAD